MMPPNSPMGGGMPPPQPDPMAGMGPMNRHMMPDGSMMPGPAMPGQRPAQPTVDPMMLQQMQAQMMRQAPQQPPQPPMQPASGMPPGM